MTTALLESMTEAHPEWMDPTGKPKLLTALLEAKKAMGPVVKGRRNDHFKTKYADLDAVLDAVEPALHQNGCLLLQPTKVTQDGKHRLVTFIVHAESGQAVSSEWELHPVKSDPQGEGSALTYARRYALLSLVGLAPEDDDGNDASTRNSQQRQQSEAERAVAQQERAELAAAAEQEKDTDWMVLLAACKTEAEVHDLGVRAHRAGMFDPNRRQFNERRAELARAATDEGSQESPPQPEGEQPAATTKATRSRS